MLQLEQIIVSKNIRFDEDLLYILQSKKKDTLSISEARNIINIIKAINIPDIKSILENLILYKNEYLKRPDLPTIIPVDLSIILTQICQNSRVKIIPKRQSDIGLLTFDSTPEPKSMPEEKGKSTSQL